jgi:hypothetical protein
VSYPNHIVSLTIAGGDSLVGHALELILQSAGYDARFLDEASLYGSSDPLEGASVVLLAPRTSRAEQEALLRRLRNSTTDKPAIPVLELVGNGGAKTGEDEGVRRVLWPCPLKELRREIEASLH